MTVASRWPPRVKRKARLEAVADSLDRIGEKGAVRRRSRGCAN